MAAVWGGGSSSKAAAPSSPPRPPRYQLGLAAAAITGAETPPRPSPVRERPGGRRRRRCSGLLPKGISVIELDKPAAAGEVARKRGAEDGGDDQDAKRHVYRLLPEAQRRKGGGAGAEGSDDEVAAALERLPEGFAEDYFSFPGAARPLHPALRRAAAEADEAPAPGTVEASAASNAQPVTVALQEEWLELLRLGFSLLVQGVGSKRRVLEAFVDKALLPSGVDVVGIDGFDARVSLPECLRGVLDQLLPSAPRAGAAVEALAAAVCAGHLAAPAPRRPLCFLVHNLEMLPPAHQAALSGLAATPGIHLVASVDNIWAPLAWSPKCLKDFNFAREEVHTYESYEAEQAARYPGGLPAWCDPTSKRGKAPKASLGLVLRSLTTSHRELVQAIAEHQLEAGGRSGISQSRLLSIATDRMIASTATKLRALLNELRDHEAVAARPGSDGGVLLYLTCDAKTLQRLSEGKEPEDSGAEESESDAEPAAT